MCLYPRLIQNKKYIPNIKNGWNPPPAKDGRVLSVPVKCGKCIECMRAKSRDWNIRLNEEIRTNTNVHFITLTLSNESINELSKNIESKGYQRDNDIITLANRRFLERWRKQYKHSLKHWFVTELGHNGTENIHIHGLVFTNEINTLESIWHYGYIFIGKYVNEKTINYITKYVSKVDLKHKYYKPIVLVSPAIGSNYINRYDSKLNKYNNTDTKETYTFKNGTKSSLPIYYRNKLYNDEERETLWINKINQHTRWVMGEKIDISKEITTYTKIVDYYRKENKRLGFGDNKKDYDQIKYENELRDLNHLKRTKPIS